MVFLQAYLPQSYLGSVRSVQIKDPSEEPPMAADRKKPRAQRARRAAAALSVAAALSLGGAMAWSETGTTTVTVTPVADTPSVTPASSAATSFGTMITSCMPPV